MSERGGTTAAGAGADADFEEGRYVFCVVAVDDPDDVVFSTAGIEEGETELVVADGEDTDTVAAVVQPVTGPFDSSVPAEIQRWLLDHQRVVDEAGERFGTPLPFRFDTVVRGDDDAVRAWLSEERPRLVEALDRFDGRWEYRVEVVYDREDAREEVAAADDELAELQAEIDAADEGTAFLLEKKYERRLESLLGEREAERAAGLAARLEPLVDGFGDLGDRPSLGLDVGDADDESETLARFALLADDDGTEAVGDELDAVAADPGVEVRFTGPWPPYSFAPSFGEVGDRGEGRGDGDGGSAPGADSGAEADGPDSDPTP
ncbi:gas vesicle protein GvpL [Halobium salinum]|uniref:Gas vesicle protein GvpL n=1 Tax=Halobium salinum TaxID=1364940 RepID=A0ABD5PHX6_9EURY|nr:GvpL/GvpF family gas vesicle protein [Halobium salinum]